VWDQYVGGLNDVSVGAPQFTATLALGDTMLVLSVLVAAQVAVPTAAGVRTPEEVIVPFVAE
jgi:hypothetical protein